MHVMLCTVAAVPHVAVWIDGENLCAGDDFGSISGRRRGERTGDGAHAADGHIPVAGTAAD
jgi:hypothetical protein